MSGAVRVAAFAVVVGSLFGAAVAVGNAVGPIERAGDDHAHADTHAERVAALPGLAIADRGFRLVLGRETLPAERRLPFVFQIVDEHGDAVRSFDVVLERRMHLIVVRRDLRTFLHVHPRLRRGGLWSVPLSLGGGVHRVFADFSSSGERVVLGADLFVRGREQRVVWPRTDYAVTLAPVRGGTRSGREARLLFSVTRDGEPVRADPYLGARGHLVILREGDLAYLHAHAEGDRLVFETTFPSAGRYHTFLQYKAGGRVRTASSSIRVPR